MGFARKTATEATEATEAKFNLQNAIEILKPMFESVIDKSMSIADEDLPEEVQAALKECATMIGFDWYNSAKTSTFYMAVRDNGDKAMYGPTVKALGEGACIVWGNERIVLGDSESLSSAKLVKLVTDRGITLLLDCNGYNMPIGVSVENQHLKKEAWPLLQPKFSIMQAIGELSNYLIRGEELLKWSDIEEEGVVSIYSTTAVMDRDDESVLKYYMALAMYQDKPCRVYCPGEAAQWNGVTIGDEPILLTKRGGFAIGFDETTYELKGGSFIKLSELEIGLEYKVSGFTRKDGGKFGTEFLLDVVKFDGSIVKVNGNKAVEARLKNEKLTAISPATPATLTIESHALTSNGKTKVNLRLTLASDAENPMLAKLKARQAAMNPAKATAA